MLHLGVKGLKVFPDQQKVTTIYI